MHLAVAAWGANGRHSTARCAAWYPLTWHKDQQLAFASFSIGRSWQAQHGAMHGITAPDKA